ncbi:class I adenylate-forming enzyme family protein [Nocardia sp. alder85J]|uniref:class I adenylate-forming enzyme family protein n=1 Tax=Nocardia sp. alder85J TaxID=2862949 RepID=UPI001CD4E7AD|nr:AMP-binding protein [Nocardia sp. alder85J]MCX4091422.1 AMP-binding protein [Nocardia sp. alder85J]
MRLHDPLEYWARRRPELRVATGPDGVSYGEAAAVTSAWAVRLGELGLRPGDRLALASGNHLDAVLILLAASKAGLVTVPLNPRLRAEDYAGFLRDSSARVVVGSASRAEALETAAAGLDLPQILIDGDRPGWQSLRDWPRSTDAPLPRADDPIALQCYTSGTTGRPKAALITHDGFVPVSARWSQAGMRFEPGEVFYLPMPIMLMAGIMMVQHALWCGAAVELDEFSPERANAALRTPGITGATFVPTMIHMMLDAAPTATPAADSTLRWILYGGTPVTPDLVRRTRDAFGAKLFQSYGCTESSAMTLLTPEDHDRALGGSEHLLRSVGRSALDCTIELLDAEDRPVAVGEVGEICSRGPHVFSGYAADPERTAAALRDGWYRTGDLGALDADGFLYLRGRKDHMIKSGGINVYPEEIEQVIAAVPGVAQVAVVGVPDERWGRRIVAAVVAAPGAAVDPQLVVDRCRAVLAAYKVPREVVFLDALPLNATGKVLKHVVRDQLSAPSTPIPAP